MKNNAGADLSLWGVYGKTEKWIFDEYYDQYIGYMVFYAIRLIHHRQDAEDIVSDSFLKLWERRRNFENHAAVHTFLQVTIRNACSNYLRSKARKETKNAAIVALLSSNEEYDPESVRIEEAVLNEIYKEIDNLPDKCREIFIRRYFGGQSNEEIAKSLNITESTVRNQKKRALDLLRSRLTGEGFLILWVSIMSVDNQLINFYSN